MLLFLLAVLIGVTLFAEVFVGLGFWLFVIVAVLLLICAVLQSLPGLFSLQGLAMLIAFSLFFGYGYRRLRAAERKRQQRLSESDNRVI